jgi:hypothetical protein
MACVMLLLWLGLMALASSPLLHAKFHSDSQNADHVCLVTQIQHQNLLAGAALILIPAAPLQEIQPPAPAKVQFVLSITHCLTPGRGPPFPALIGKVVG